MNNSEDVSTFTETQRYRKCPICGAMVFIKFLTFHKCWNEELRQATKIAPPSGLVKPNIKRVTMKIARQERQQLVPRGLRYQRMLKRETTKAEKLRASRMTFKKKSTLVANNEFYGRKAKNKNVTP